ncbi:hypothetical protein [Flavitalea sp.]|nr:hypothetical protein [Flavitalea sp.]
MKKLFILTAVFMLSIVFVKAQSADPELDYIKKAYSKDKKTLVEEYMALDVQEGGKFWPIYSEYEKKREKLATERLKLIEEYASLDSINAAQADKTANGALSNTISLDKLNQEYYGKLKKSLGAVKAAKLLQLEIYLQTAWKGFVQNNIPLIGELDKTQKN